jgi:outer membrane protein
MHKPLMGAQSSEDFFLNPSSSKFTSLPGYLFSLAALFILLPVNPAVADEDKTSWGIGLGAGIQEPAYLGFDRRTRALPFLFIENSWMQLAGPNLDIKLGQAGGVYFAMRANFALGDGYDESDSYIFSGMEERDESIWVGPSLTWKNDIVDVSFEALADSFGNSEGQQASLEFSRSFRVGQRFNIEPSIGATWFSDKYVDYYYGVEASEARIDRPEYEGEATVVLSTGLRVTYGIDQHQLILFNVGLQSFDREIEDSPLIDQSTEGSVALGYLYRF